MSQAQSISNICYQRVLEINAQIAAVNNASKTVKIAGEDFLETQAVPMPTNIVDLILIKGKLTATQAFLMEAIKAKDEMIDKQKLKRFDIAAFVEKYPEPEAPTLQRPAYAENVVEAWGWEQLSFGETAEFIEVEAYAAAIGKFIHKDGKLTKLRTEVSTMKTLEWIVIEDGKKTPVKVNIHHNADDLLAIHMALAEKHREYEARVNYFKAKVKNLVTLKNADIAKANAELMQTYTSEYKELRDKYNAESTIWKAELDKQMKEFEAAKALELKELVGLRISVEPRFQEVIDTVLDTIKVADKE